MEPNIWDTVETANVSDTPAVYALTDALLQFRDKFEREMTACEMATGPINVIAVFTGEPETIVDSHSLANLAAALEVVWPDAFLCEPSSMPSRSNDMQAMASAAAALPAGYAVNLYISEARNSVINLIDRNFKLFQLHRTVSREELKLFVRVTDLDGTALFLDEFTVSPTILADALVSPLGGLIIRLEKNSTRQLVVDFGPLNENGDHVLRFNDAYHKPATVPLVFENNAIEDIDHHCNSR